MSRIAILGGGSWGTALAIVLSRARRKHDISLWVHDPALAATIHSDRENKIYLPGQRLAPEVRVSHNVEDVLAGATIIVGAMPAAHARAVFKKVAECVGGIARGSAASAEITFVSATKGLEPATHKRVSEIMAEVLSPELVSSLAVLSGPSFAAEAARGEPTAVVLASQSQTLRVKWKVRRYTPLVEELQEEFAGPNFRVYTNEDVLGVELAGAMKNVIAIAAGVCQGLGLGSNPLAALITRGLAEMSRLADALRAQPETLTGLAGLGDLVLTCTGALSRNRQVGIELGKGRALSEILAGMRMVAEGVGTTAALIALARDAKVELPITQQVAAILHEGKAPREAIRDIMERPQRPE
jgi:glycerol-3-phosphate dehydrogenase (NAD(P)+)